MYESTTVVRASDLWRCRGTCDGASENTPQAHGGGRCCPCIVGFYHGWLFNQQACPWYDVTTDCTSTTHNYNSGSTEHVNAHQQRKHLLGGRVHHTQAAAVAGAMSVNDTAPNATAAIVLDPLPQPARQGSAILTVQAMPGQAQPHPEDIAGEVVPTNTTIKPNAQNDSGTSAAAAATQENDKTTTNHVEHDNRDAAKNAAKDAATTTDTAKDADTQPKPTTQAKSTITLPFARHRRRKRPRPSTDAGYGDGYGIGSYFDYTTDTVRHLHLRHRIRQKHAHAINSIL